VVYILWYILSWVDFGVGWAGGGQAGLNRRAKRARIARSARAVWFNLFSPPQAVMGAVRERCNGRCNNTCECAVCLTCAKTELLVLYFAACLLFGYL
jgi:hypothetical protein